MLAAPAPRRPRRAPAARAALIAITTLASAAGAARAEPAAPFGPQPAPAPLAPAAPALAPAPPAPPAPRLGPAPRATPSADDPWAKLTAYGAVGLALAGGALWLARRRRLPAVPAPSIDVLAQRSLSARSKIVWLAAGGRELLVAVTPQQIRVLAAWRAGRAAPLVDAPSPAAAPTVDAPSLPAPAPATAIPAAAAPAAAATAVPAAPPAAARVAPAAARVAPAAAAAQPPAPPPPSPAPPPRSPAVAGIIRLRAKTRPPPELEDNPTDIAWAQELLAATTRARRRTASGGDPR